MPKPVILITSPEFDRAESTFAACSDFKCVSAAPSEPEFVRLIEEWRPRHVILGPMTYRGALYDVLTPGSVIARFGVGFDGVDLQKATAAGLFVTNTPGQLTQSVAEHAMALILAAARHVSEFDRRMHGDVWMPRPGTEVHGKTLAIIGMGQIGRALARIATIGFGMRVIGWRRAARSSDDAETASSFAETTSEFGEAVRRADYVSLHLAANTGTEQFMNEARLAMVAPHAWLVNTSRGALVDELALHAALRNGALAGAALDVFVREPYVPETAESDLRRLPNVLLAPHVGSNTVDANRRMAERALRNLTLCDAGDFDDMDLLNRDVRRPPAR